MLKLNVDGSIIQGGRKVTYGGILRNEMGFWLTSFSYNLGSYSVLMVALMGILIGLRLAWEKGFRNVWLECDASNAIKLAIDVRNFIISN